MKINVTGNAGSGKSTLAQQISQALQFPLIEMDRILFAPNWEQVLPELWQAQLTAQLQQKSWVLDGVSKLARQQADLIVFLDYPSRICAWRCAKRNWRYLWRSRPGLPENCPEWKIILPLAKIIKDFPNHTRIAILKDIQESQKHTVIIKNATDMNQFLSTLSDLLVHYPPKKGG
jgi:adenylate kinase family enzyme